MAIVFPPTEAWRAISDVLADEQRTLVNNKISEIQKRKSQEREQVKSDEEKKAEEVKRKAWLDSTDPNGFYGNMGQPETAEEYKNRYGVYTPGYDGEQK